MYFHCFRAPEVKDVVPPLMIQAGFMILTILAAYVLVQSSAGALRTAPHWGQVSKGSSIGEDSEESGSVPACKVVRVEKEFPPKRRLCPGP